MIESRPPASTRPTGIKRYGATVAPEFVSGMLVGLRRRQIDPTPLLLEAGIDLAEIANRISVERYARLYSLVVARLDDEGFGLFSRKLPPGTFEFLCRGMLGATTLGFAIARACRFLAIVLPDLTVTVTRSGAAAELRIIESLPLAFTHHDPGRVFAFEWLLRLLHSVACWFAGRGLPLDAVAFPYTRPPHADDYALVYTAHSRFEAQDLVARFDGRLLDLPIRRDDAALARFLVGAPGKISMLYRRDREMVARVRDILRDHLSETPSLGDVARQLHLSSRTLARRLEDEGSSFRTIRDAIRRDVAFARLSRTNQTIGDLAGELGYADPSAFYRAFVSWSGESPEHFRRRLANRENRDA